MDVAYLFGFLGIQGAVAESNLDMLFLIFFNDIGLLLARAYAISGKNRIILGVLLILFLGSNIASGFVCTI